MPMTHISTLLNRFSPMLRRGRLVSMLILTGLSMLCTSVALADILVMADGSQVETDGAWQVKGRQVTFTSTTGTLSVVRLADVDLDASRTVTEAALRVDPPEESEDQAAGLREPVLTLTNDDIGPGRADDSDASDDTGAAGTIADEGLVVSSWSYEPGGGDPAYELLGELTNQTGVLVENILLYVDFVAVDDAGEPMPASHFLRQARITETSLEAGESTSFRYPVSFQDLQFSGAAAARFEDPRVSFDVQFRRLGPARVVDDELESDDSAGALEVEDVGSEGG